MVNLLIVIGIIFVGLSFWRGKVQSAQQQEEFEGLKQIRDELVEAKKEVGTLLEQIEVVSEKVVQEISAKVEEAKLLEKEDNSSAIIEEDEEQDEPEEQDYDDEYTDEPADMDLAVRKALLNSPVTPRQKTNARDAAKSKTIMFPRRKNMFDDEQRLTVSQSQPVTEPSPKHQMVYAMAKLGYSEDEIAKQLKIGKGEVKLILQLKRKGEEANV
ncbi:MAG: hypothetical protein CVV03_02340 [Firmicutes bacterium HGW-Firmicutes-8]|nr:MAG: hypothetical protein CVV03_02340 [Firmicutes bacterium HGW-Firmicutes-8]